MTTENWQLREHTFPTTLVDFELCLCTPDGVTVCRVTKRKLPVATRKFVEAGAAPTLQVLYSSFSKSDNISHGEVLVFCSHRTRLYTMTSLFVFLALATLGLSEASDLPGLKIRLSAKALDYGW